MPTDRLALFEALNARKLNAAEVASSFVVSPQYAQLVGTDHCVLVGPRGSGKTTLLRMLEGESLTSWTSAQGRRYRNQISYSTVFVPVDRLWSQRPPGHAPGQGLELGYSAFTTHLLYALVETFLYRTQRRGEVVLHGVSMERELESELVAECAATWQLDPLSPSFRGLQSALDRRLSVLSSVISGLESADDYHPSWLGLSALESLGFGLRAFNRYANQPEHRWALLVDEMELAPRMVHEALQNELRGREPRLILKLSYSPVDRRVKLGEDSNGASPDNDFKPIYLWYGTRSGGRALSRGIWRWMVTNDNRRYNPLTKVLGLSAFETPNRDWGAGGTAYKTGSPQQRLISKMADQDAGFRTYLQRKRIDPGNLEAISDQVRASTLRKVYPLLVFRDAVLTFSDGQPIRRQRKKALEPFTGQEAVLAALEGNPRWLKAVFSRLLSNYDGRQIPPGAQYDTLLETAQRFEALLRILPAEGTSYAGASVLSLVETIVDFFNEKATGGFAADAPSSFVVDRSVPEAIQALLRTALSAGAVVHLRNRRSPAVLQSLMGERFRVTYLLTLRDQHESPMRLNGKSVGLSRILASGTLLTSDEEQGTLPLERA